MNKHRQKGFTLLYALLVISVVLGITSSIMHLMLKELKLTGFTRDTQIANYAAESGLECAYYWTLRGYKFDGSGTITCNGQTFTNATSSFSFGIASSSACTKVTVTSAAMVNITSVGLNTCANTTYRIGREIKITHALVP